MTATSRGLVLACALLALPGTGALAQGSRSVATPGKPAPRTKAQARPRADTGPPAKTETATFAGGCFWSFEAVFERVPGVVSVTSGFAGGSVSNPSYEQVCTGQTGHAEAIEVEYDPKQVTYDRLLHVFFTAHDPTTVDSQGDDFGPQYRSMIFYHDDEQKQAALKVYKELTAKRAFRGPIVTDLVPASTFFPAEPYHQDYYRNHRDSEYTANYIVPKLRKLKAKLGLK